jgi:hypothetical protein
MRLSKPRYDSTKKVYESAILDGLRLTAEVEAGQPPPATLQTECIPSLTECILKQTVGWFTKPITETWLAGKVRVSFDAIPADFDGRVTWAAQRLLISKDVFMVEFTSVESVPTPPVAIDFGEEEPAAVAPPVAAPAAPPVAAPATESLEDLRQIQKAKVMKARLRAARALFTAERMTQDYIQEFCLEEDTDWEESDEENESDDD